jgi:hypothetical protein
MTSQGSFKLPALPEFDPSFTIMPADLLPEKPLLVSPTLAATIGLEEALMLQALADLIQQRPATDNTPTQGAKWVELDEQLLQEVFPFWQSVDLRRVQASLKSLGLIAIEPNRENRHSNYYAIELAERQQAVFESQHGQHNKVRQPIAASPETPAGTATLIPFNWQPDANWVRLCKQHAVPEQYIHSLVPEFVSYWRERGQARFSWGNAFYKHVLKEWRKEQTRQGAYELASNMSADWWPSQDAVEILVNAGINPEFIEDAVPEFVLYWRERGVVHGAWNTKFIEHIRRQWAKYSASFGRDDTPRPIPEDWQPSSDCYEILQLAEIDEDYARSKIPEFVMYWRDSQQVKASWNTVFLQFIKLDWARQLKQQESQLGHGEDQTLTGSSQQRIKERFQRIADRSWAD